MGPHHEGTKQQGRRFPSALVGTACSADGRGVIAPTGWSLYEKSATSWLKTLALTAATPPKTVSATIDGFTLVR